MQSLSSIKPAETKENSIYVAVSTSITLASMAFLSWVYKIELNAEMMIQLLFLSTPILGVLLYYSRWDEKRAESILSVEISKDITSFTRFVIRFSFLLETWKTTIALYNRPEHIIGESIDSIIRGGSMRREVWSERISGFMRIILACIILSASFLSLSAGFGEQIPIFWAGLLGFEIGALSLKWLYDEREKRSKSYLSLGGVFALILISVAFLSYFWADLSIFCISLSTIAALDWILLRWIDIQRAETVNRAVRLIKARMLHATLTYENILRTQRYGKSARVPIDEMLRNDILDEIEAVELFVQQFDWPTTINRTDRLISLVEHLADDAIVGRRSSHPSITDQLSKCWTSITIGSDSDAWPEFIWVRTLAVQMLQLDMQPPNKPILKRILRLNPKEISDPYFLAKIIGTDKELPDKDHLEYVKSVIDSHEFEERAIVDSDAFLKAYITDIKGWEYEVISESVQKAALQSLSHPEIEEALRGVLRNNPKDQDAHLDLAVSLWQQGKNKEALERAMTALKLNSKKVMPWFVIGAIHNRLGNYTDGVNAFTKAMEIEPDDAGIHYLLGYSQMRAGQLNDAVASLRKSVELDPNDWGTWEILGNAQEELGHIEEAEKAYREALRRGYYQESNHYTLARFYYRHKRPVEALSITVTGLSLFHDSEDLQELMGQIMLELRDFEGAERAFEKASTMNPKKYSIYVSLALAKRNLGKLDETESVLQDAISLNPTSSLAWRLLANTKKEQGILSEAEKFLTKAYELRKDELEDSPEAKRDALISMLNALIEILEEQNKSEDVENYRKELLTIASQKEKD
ncbi:MAG: tetratricopeptide repeat protein [Candidatus Thorarchaeota archaeon]